MTQTDSTSKDSIRSGGVVTCMEQPAADAGAEILRAGGNAADAAIATAFAQCVVDPVYAGIAGTFHGVFWDAKEMRAIAISGGSRAPLKAQREHKPSGRFGGNGAPHSAQRFSLDTAFTFAYGSSFALAENKARTMMTVHLW